VRLAAPDAVVVSRYCQARAIDVYLLTPAATLVGAALAGAAAGCSRQRLRTGFARVLARVPDLADDRPHGRFTVTADLDGHRATASATDVYGFTAAAAVHVAELATRSPDTPGLKAATQLDTAHLIARHLGVQLQDASDALGATA
jgi:hypothetical protein